MADTILVVAEQREGRLNRVSFETIAAAQSLAKDTGWSIEAVLAGDNLSAPAAELASKAVARVHALEAPALAAYTSDAYVHALKAFLAEKQPALVLFPHTYQVRDFAPRLALALDRALISDATGCRFENGKLLFTRQMFQGKFSADVSFADDTPSATLRMATLQIGAYRGDEAQAGPENTTAPVEHVTAAVANTPPRVTPHEVFQESGQEAKQAVDLSQAEVIVAVGRGIKEQKNLALAEALAQVLHGEVAASRPICDNGWLPLDRQIGSSGQTVAPKLYFALGISGAIQHIVGMKGSRTIVAINKDAEAPIFEIADVGIVGNLFDIVPALTEEIKKATA
ncbi:electron transfer flavoprotein subunit alpha/FixB family protein [Paracidobacterium acidisoli]|uniref:Electron transfer flavoprotein subunit alpha/FixB family protein n=1 Tax=Paracidobacterium acidisoli TaxID=2303751 RepID=A0A372IPT0_9BACT|nr:electron transfer flavoprotein subunit alpha/FixB family protein [Paracidobacterium acidisoli]MBT9331306.1 electron transfer flavoprotein subunit alpha/FixB family protein [Paracidobacterium acidisoli]